jgi:cytochrome P450
MALDMVAPSNAPELVYDPMAPADWDDPYPTYRRLRDEAPVHYSPASNMYTLSRHDDVVWALRHPELFSSASAFDVLFAQLTSDVGIRDFFALARFLIRARVKPSMLAKGPADAMITLDPPRHDALRAIVNRGFTPKRIEAWQKRVDEIVAECMAKLRQDAPFDVVRDLAMPVPMSVIAEMIGIESERRHQFKEWSDQIIEGVSSKDRRRTRRGFLDGMANLTRYVQVIVDARRKEPRDDLISLLVDPSQGETLDDNAIMQFVLLLLIAGNETTTNLIGNAVVALLEHPDQLQRVVDDPELIPNLVDETIRYDGPVQFIMRRAARDVEVAGGNIPADGRVCILLGSANRDERRFDDPDRFDVGRDARGHVGFGFGLHFCLGASLARLEAETALRALVPELPGLRPERDRHEMIDSVLVRGRARLALLPT